MIPQSPPRYRHPSGIECWQISQHLPHPLASAFEYVWRHRQKGGCEDLRKAVRWLRIERERRRWSRLADDYPAANASMLRSMLTRLGPSVVIHIVYAAIYPSDGDLLTAARVIHRLHRELRREDLARLEAVAHG